MESYYVEDFGAENTTLGRDVRFSSYQEAARAQGVLLLWRSELQTEIVACNQPPTTTFAEWNAQSWA